MGDPGLFGFIGKAINTVGKVASATGLPGVSQLGSLADKLVPDRLVGGGSPPPIPQLPTIGPGISGPPQPFTGAGTAISTATAGMQASQHAGGTFFTDTKKARNCPSGQHPNKSAYFRKTADGLSWMYVPVGHACVKNRRRNPLNPRATSRAIARLKQTKRAIQTIEKQFPTKPAPRRARHHGGRHGGRGGGGGGKGITVIDTE